MLFIIVICGFDTEVFGMQVNLADIKKKIAQLPKRMVLINIRCPLTPLRLHWSCLCTIWVIDHRKMIRKCIVHNSV